MINLQNCTDKERGGEENVFMTIAFNIIRDLGVPDSAAIGIATALCQLMSTTERFYHTIVHINDIYRLVGAKQIQLTEAERLAILFHDAVYVVGKTPESEIQSANLMKAFLSAYPIKHNVLKEAEEIILATARHTENVEDTKVQRVLDLDLSGFASAPHEFTSRNELITLEIGFGNNEKRAAFLQKFLDKPRIFYQLGDLEQQARSNIRREIQLLKQ